MSDVHIALPQRTSSGKAAIIAIVLPVLVAFEGFAHVAVHQRIDPAGVITVCAGITNYDLPTLKSGDRFTTPECAALLKAALPKYQAEVDKCIHVPMPPHRAAAILDFTYNVGGGMLCKSRVARELNAGHVAAGCDALLAYDRANHKRLAGLTRRRKVERDLCMRED